MKFLNVVKRALQCLKLAGDGLVGPVWRRQPSLFTRSKVTSGVLGSFGGVSRGITVFGAKRG